MFGNHSCLTHHNVKFSMWMTEICHPLNLFRYVSAIFKKCVPCHIIHYLSNLATTQVLVFPQTVLVTVSESVLEVFLQVAHNRLLLLCKYFKIFYMVLYNYIAD